MTLNVCCFFFEFIFVCNAYTGKKNLPITTDYGTPICSMNECMKKKWFKSKLVACSFSCQKRTLLRINFNHFWRQKSWAVNVFLLPFFSLDMLVDVNVCIKCEIVVNDWFSTAVADDVDDNDDDVIGGGKVRCYAGVSFIHDINKYLKWLVWHVFIPTETFIAWKILCLTYLFFGTFFTFPSSDVFQNRWENFTIFFLHLEFLILEHTLSIHFSSFEWAWQINWS